jgi:aromatase
VTARHTVAINPAAVAEIAGLGHGLTAARSYLRDALGANTRETLEHVSSISSQAVEAAREHSSLAR